MPRTTTLAEEAKTYRKKPIEIRAVQLTLDNSTDILMWINQHGQNARRCPDWNGNIEIETLEGTMHAAPSDFIIRGIQGEFYPCKPDIFNATYEEVVNGD